MYSKKIAEFVTSLNYEDLPKEVIEKAKDCVRDHLGCVLGAYPIEESKMVAEWVRDLGDRNESTIFGWGYKTSCRNAAFANGYFAEVLETQDGTSYGNNHPASVILPATLAVAEHLEKGGKEFLTAVVAGYEVTNRISASLPPAKSMGFVKTGIAGALAASLSVGKLLGLNSSQLVHALGIAGFILPISSRENMSGPTIKPVLGGQAAKAGIEAALLAQKGFTGCEEILMGTPPRYLGLCNIICQEPVLDKLTEDLGQRFTILDVYFKPYAACRLAHSAIEAALALVTENAIPPGAIERIEVKTFARAANLIGGRYPEADSSFITCQFSLPYLLAVVVSDRTIGPKQYRREKISDPKIQAIAKKVQVTSDDLLTSVYPAKSPARVRICVRDGRAFEKQIDQPKWQPERGISKEEHLAKFHALASEILPKERIEKIDHIIDHLDKLERISTLIEEAIL
jgi:2-methylcitrate dehydratase PrpD